METIWKYNLKGSGTIVLPKGAVVVHAGLQNDEPHIWVRINPKREGEIRKFKIVGTGYPLDPTDIHLGTFQQPPFVWHVVEVRDPAEDRS